MVQGPLSFGPHNLAVEANGNILVVSEEGSGVEHLLCIDPNTDHRTLVSDFADPGQGLTGIDVVDIVVVGHGNDTQGH